MAMRKSPAANHTNEKPTMVASRDASSSTNALVASRPPMSSPTTTPAPKTNCTAPRAKPSKP